MFDQLFIDLPKEVTRPCIASATEHCGEHNAGSYCIHPEKLRDVKDVVMCVSCEDLWVEVL
eukprot:4143142-Karenia_brevis.AAC.1